jgi:predicted nucleic acid-binding Zn ribbon protein
MEQRHSSINYRAHSHKQSDLQSEIQDLLKGIKTYQKEKFSFWEEVVGEKIAGVAVPVKNKKGVLIVKVRDAVWKFELTRRKEEILKMINGHFKKSLVKDIVFI